MSAIAAAPEITAATGHGRTRRFGAESILARLHDHVARLDELLLTQVSAFEPEIRDMAAYCLDTAGKRLRPALVFLSGWNTGARPDASLIKAAAVVEMVHLATLVHDDIMDRADRRRARPTAARQWGPAAAVLLGDTLFAQAVRLSTEFPTPDVCRVVSEAARRVCSGEILQTLSDRQESPRSLYWRVIDLKTAELFRASCWLGAHLGGHGPAFREDAAQFGRRLGLAYQVYDDLLDYLGDEAKAGKTLGTDLATGKITLPLIEFLETPLGAAWRREFKGGPLDAEAREVLRSGLLASGAAGHVAARAHAEIRHAESLLAGHESVPATAQLLELAGLLTALLHDLCPAT